MIIFLFFSVAVILGALVSYILKINIFWEERIAWGAVLGSVFLSAISFIFSWFFGFSAAAIVASFLFLASIIAVFFFKNRQKILQNIIVDFRMFKDRIKNGRLTAFLSIFLVLLAVFGFLWAKVFYQADGEIFTIGTNGVWGDWAAHSAYVSHFAYSDEISLEHPLFSGEKFSYTFMADFLSAVLIKLGAGFIPAMIVPGFIFSLILIVILYHFFLRIFVGKEAASALAVFLFIFGGGLGFFYFFRDAGSLPLSGLMDFFENSPKEYSHLIEQNINWTAFINGSLLPQRALTMGMPLGFLILSSVLIALKEKNNKLLLVSGIFAAFLPAIHVHSLIAVSISAFFLIILLSEKSARRVIEKLLFFFAPAAILSFWQILLLFPSDGYGLKFQLGWMAKNENWLFFWIKNLGLFFVLAPLAFFFAEKRLKMIYLSFLPVFIAANLFLFQPHDYDNIKIMEYWFALSAAITAVFLVKIWEKGVVAKILVGVTAIFLTLSPFLDLLHLYFYPNYSFLSKSDIEIAQLVRAETPPDSIFLTSDRHNHPIPVLTGRQILMGYRGWLWTYGIDYSARQKDIKEIFGGGSKAKELLRRYKVDYVFIGPSEKSEWGADEKFFSDNYPIVIRSDDAKIYKIRD